MRKNKRYSMLILLTMIFVLIGSFTANAEEKLGSIEIELTDGGMGTSKEGVVFSYDKVADLEDGEYVLLDQYKGSQIEFDKIEYAKDMEVAAEKLVTFVKQNDTKKVTTDDKGKAKITDLPVGVYLVYVVDKADYDEVSPFLISIPTFNEKDMEYDLKVLPKHQPNPPGKITTQTPPTPNVKTGDNANLKLYFSLSVAAIFLLVVVVAFRRYQQKKWEGRNEDILLTCLYPLGYAKKVEWKGRNEE